MLTRPNLRAPFHLLAAALCLAAFAAPFAHADDATRRAKVEELMRLTKTDEVMQQQLTALKDRVNELAAQQSGMPNMTPAQKALTDAYLKQVQGATADEVGWDKLRPVVVQAYADTYTEADLDSIIAFYKTPAGQTLVAKTPEVANKTTAIVQGRIKELQPKLAQMTDDYVNKMKATETPAAPKPTTPATAPRSAAPAK